MATQAQNIQQRRIERRIKCNSSAKSRVRGPFEHNRVNFGQRAVAVALGLSRSTSCSTPALVAATGSAVPRLVSAVISIEERKDRVLLFRRALADLHQNLILRTALPLGERLDGNPAHELFAVRGKGQQGRDYTYTLIPARNAPVTRPGQK